jgi:pimeloyl-ACP methyl ester carboxylesterase
MHWQSLAGNTEKDRLAMDKLAQAGRLRLGEERELAYSRLPAVGFGGSKHGVIFLGGFRSDMTGTKAMFLEERARAMGVGFLRFDYTGHGTSSGRFEAAGIGHWRDDAIAIVDRLSEGPQILIGSSMGGWLMLLVALARPDRVAGLIGIAAAPDFTEQLIWDELNQADRDEIVKTGRLIVPSPYSEAPTVITRQLIEEGRRHLLLGAPIGLRCPVRLLHGMADPDVPHRLSLDLADRLESEDCQITLVKDGDHRLSRPQDLALLGAKLVELLG